MSMFQEALTRRYMTRLLATPEGRAHVLSQSAEAESSGEGGVFVSMMEHVDDPALRKVIARHQADEVRHAELFRECVARTGVTLPEPPKETQLIDRLDAALGFDWDGPIRGARDVARAYLVLQVIEERAITQFQMYEPLFRKHDAKTADVIGEIAADEERHLKYCGAVLRRVMTDEVELKRELARYRAIEARVFAENSVTNSAYTMERGYFVAPAWEKLAFRGVIALTKASGSGPRTPYWGADLAAA
jgi:rubrerythrin